MRKVYFIGTGLLAALAVFVFVILGIDLMDDKSTALCTFVLAAACAGCLVVTILGLKKGYPVSGTALVKTGILLIGLAVIILSLGLYPTDNRLLEALVLSVPIGILGGICVTKGRAILANCSRKDNTGEKSTWNAYKNALFMKMPFLRPTLRKGASVAEIRAAESEIGYAFPEALKELYLANDGDDRERLCGMILGFHFLSLEEMLTEWRSLKSIAGDESLNKNDRFSSVPAGYVRRCYADAGWIPFCSPGGGNYIGVDLNPDAFGSAGQIINFGRDEIEKTVLAEDLNAFFARLTRIVHSTDFHIGEYDGEKVVLLGKGDAEEGFYLTDYLKAAGSVK